MSASGKSPIAGWNACPCAGATLDKLIQPAILAVLARGPLHGYKLAERIGRLPTLRGRKPDNSGVYRFLRSMERKGIVVSSWDFSQAGPARKSYRLTRTGQNCLAHWIQTLQAYRQEIGVLLKTAQKAVARKRGARSW